jgi:hypothetical protein
MERPYLAFQHFHHPFFFFGTHDLFFFRFSVVLTQAMERSMNDEKRQFIHQ